MRAGRRIFLWFISSQEIQSIAQIVRFDSETNLRILQISKTSQRLHASLHTHECIHSKAL